MKLMQVCFSPIIGGAGGVEKVFCNMSNYFCSKYDVINICCDNKEGEPFFFLNNKAKFNNLALNVNLKVPLDVKIWNEFIRLFKQIGLRFEFPREVYVRKQISGALRQCLEDVKPDAVICYELRSMVLLVELGYDLRKIVVMFHSSAEDILMSMSNKQRDILRRVRYVQVLLNSDKEKLIEQGYDNVVCINNIVPEFESISFDCRENTIINIGRLNREQKRQHILIDAFAKIAHKYPDWQVKFFGALSRPRDYETKLKKMIFENQLQNQVFLMGKISDVPNELKKAKILGFPSAYEGFSLALTEAMACGLPSVGFKSAPSVNELIKDGHNGILCDDNVESFAKALEELICDEEKRVRYGKNAIEDMKEYAPDIIYKQWENLIESMM